MLTNNYFDHPDCSMSDRVKKKSSEIIRENRNRTSPLQNHFLLVAHNIRSLHNIGALFRSSDAFGIHKLILSGYTPSPPHASIRKTALGADEYVPWQHCGNDLQNCLEEWKSDGYNIHALEQTTESVLLNRLEPTNRKLCLILGNEVTGIEESLIPYVDTFIEIPQFGEKHSLNVSVAAGIALYGYLEKWYDGE